MTTELLEALETVIKRFRVTPSQAADLTPAEEDDRPGKEPETNNNEVIVTWQRVTARQPMLLVTVPLGEDGWAMPTPYRPDWLVDLIVKNAPEWWLK